MLTSETKNRINACRDVLVGKLPLPSDQVELITLALIYKFMDDLDEDSVALGGKRSFFTGALAPYRWRALLPQTVSADDRVTLFSEGLEYLGGTKRLRNEKTGKDVDIAAHLPALFRDIFRNAFLKFRDGRILTLFLTEVNGFAYSHSEELGNAFEYLLQSMGTQGENGQFRTPRHIIDWIAACLDPQPTDKILDPACGTGGFLVSAFRHILAKHTSPGSKLPGDRLGHEERQRLYANFTGYDITDLMVKLSKVNLFLHQFPSPTIQIYDTLSNDARWSEKADLILANPPFMTPKGGVTPHTKFRIPAKKAEVLFTDYIAEHLTPDGRAGIIVPNGIVATTQNAYVKLRRFLVEDSLVAVVSLPAGVFRPYSGVKTSILLLDKKLARKTDQVLFLKITADGFDLGDQRRESDANDLHEAERVVKSWLKGELTDDFASPIAYALVEKKQLLAHRALGLQVEPYLGGPAVEHEVEVARLADIAEINPKKAEVRSLASETPVSFVPMEALNVDRPSFSARRERPIGEVLTGYTYFRDGDVLLAKITPCFENGKAGIARDLRNGIGFGSSEFHVFRCGEKVVPEYLYYFITRPAFREEGEQNMSGTGGQQRVTREFLENHEIPLPPLEEQRRIVAEIEGYQQVIDGARKILAAYRQSVESAPDISLSVLSEAGELIGGYAFKSSDMTAAPVKSTDQPVVKIGNVGRDGRLDMIDAQYHAFTPELARYSLRIGDIVIAMTGATVGKVAEVDRNDLLLNQRVCVVRAKPNFSQRYLLHVLRSRAFYDFCQTTAGGGAQGNIAPRQILEYQIPLPPLPEQERIVAELDAEAARLEAVRGLIPAFEAKIQRVLARVWGTA